MKNLSILALFLLLAASFPAERARAAIEGPARLLPAPGEIAGWKTDGEPLFYTEENLWEYINGAAENFVSFEFREVAAQDYLDEGGAGLKVEIYEHGSPLMAYGIYAQMRSPDLDFLEIGNEAFADEYSLHFWKGRYYVRVAVYDRSPGLEAAVKVFAASIAAKIEEPGALPPEASCFPPDGLVAKDTRYLAEGVLGRAKYPPSFVATYRWENESAKLYLSTLPDSAAARGVFDWYVSETGGAPELVRAAGGPCLQSSCKDPYQGAVVTFQFGRWFGSLVGLEPKSPRGEKLLRETVENLGKIEY
jgi:hypothetical protein